MMVKTPATSKELGFTIIELMIAIGLGMLIIAGLAQIYLSNRNTFLVEEGLARLQENGRYANYLINKDVRMASFIGCGNHKKIKIANLIKNPGYTYDLINPIRGYDSSSSTFSPNLPANLNSKAMPGSDVIEVRMASFSSNNLSGNMLKNIDPIPMVNRSNINAGDAVLITDCKVGDLFIAESNNTASVITHSVSKNTQNNLSTAYTKSARVMNYTYYAYYVKNTGRTNGNNQPIYALVRQDAAGNEVEIAEGVEKMRILYVVDTNKDNIIDSYQTATQVQNSNNWANVKGIQLSLLVSTPEDVNNKVQTYVFNGTTFTPTDRKLRREWDSFVNVRNRGL